MDSPDDLLSTEQSLDDGAAILVVKGEVDTYTVGRFEAAIRGAIEQSSHLRIDISGVLFMDSSGLNALVTARNECERRDGSLTLVDVQPDLRRIFDLSGLADTFVFEP